MCLSVIVFVKEAWPVWRLDPNLIEGIMVCTAGSPRLGEGGMGCVSVRVEECLQFIFFPS